MPEPEEDRAWHLDKKVPIAMIVAIVVQTFGVGWWLSSLNSRVAALEAAAPNASLEFSKLETAREATNLSVARIETKIDSVLSISRRLDSKLVQPPQEH